MGKARVSELKVSLCVTEDFPGGSDGKMSACNEGDLGLIPGLGGSLEGGRATHSSILAWRSPMDRGAWWAIVHEAAELDTTERQKTMM